MHPLLPILTVISVAFVIVFILMMQLRMKQMQQATHVLDEYQLEKTIAYTSAANFIGIESVGVRQVRGNGFLLLTDTNLVFERLAPKLRVKIPVRKIQRVDLVQSFLGKRNVKAILRVVYLNDEAQLDSMGILVRETERWQRLIKNTSDTVKKIV